MPDRSARMLGGACALSVLVALSSCTPATILPGEMLPIAVESDVITDLGGNPALAPGLTFLGGVELSSPEPLFGAFSSIRFRDEQSFLGVFDTGYWIEGRILRDGDGRLAGLDAVRLAPLLDASGRESRSKFLVDAESLALNGDRAFVGFEQRHRVVAYAPLADLGKALPSAPLAFPFDLDILHSNGGFESLVVAPKGSPVEGALVAITEKSFDENGNIYAAIVGGPLAGEFRVRPRDDFDITDAAFLPDGDLLLLERRFSIATGVGMRLRRVEGTSILPGAVVDGEILFEANYRSQIDNMEGLDVIPEPDGSVRLIVVSDDNHSILQRTLMLEFRLTPQN
ncbi:MAG: esterase-like activity of phytase family protein [Rhizobium rhizophilum]|uniref:esterase-like activity of phytase family protein n=1 Tax=Rhizobium rhizophilum TaxID=1850373 RepID=UPI00391B93DE